MNSALLNSVDTIVALSTPQGEGAIAVIRLSGSQSISIVDKYFKGKTLLSEAKTHTLHFGRFISNGELLDEVVVSLYKNPRSYTGEDVVEISCHGSRYVAQQIIQACLQGGARMAQAGEFTQRAFLNGKLDLSQAESVAAIIASENRHQLDMAFRQMRGGYSELITKLREELIEFAALIELELDFSDEDVEFANRDQFHLLLQKIEHHVNDLVSSFELGNVLKEGIPVAIIGEPNVGKSTLLNALLQEEKAIVSDIAGTTRDFIEDVLTIDGLAFRFIDTAGLRQTDDVLEAKGIERSIQKMQSAKIILFLADIQQGFRAIATAFKSLTLEVSQHALIVLNKSDAIAQCDAYDVEEAVSTLTGCKTLELSASTGHNLDKLKQLLVEMVQQQKLAHGSLIVSNARHVDALNRTLQSIKNIQTGMVEGRSGDLLSVDIRMALHSLGEITGAVEIDRDILGTIFGKFCIGK
jgi:tRNA modification GTPase